MDIVKLAHPVIGRVAPAVAPMPVVVGGVPDRDRGIDGRPVVANHDGIRVLARAGRNRKGSKPRDLLDPEGGRRIGLWIQHEASPVVDDLAWVGGCGGAIVGGVALHLARLRIVHGHQPLVGDALLVDIVDRSARE